MTRRDRVFSALALLWLAVAVGAAAADWPTPARIAEDRMRLALLTANAFDKTVRPYDVALRGDLDAQYQELVADFQDRFGDRFDTTLIERRHAEAVSGMAAERRGIVIFSVASTAAFWLLLRTIRALLGRQSPNR